MYAVLYYFKVKSGFETQFIEMWKALTRLIKTYEHSLGSRLHKQKDLHFIAYAMWHSKKQFENSGNNLPERAAIIKKEMRACCDVIEIMEQLDVVEDLLISKKQ